MATCTTNLSSSTSTTQSPQELKVSLAVTSEQQLDIEKEQNKSDLWFQLRNSRLTSSNFGVIAKRKTKFENLASQIIKQKRFCNLDAVPAALKWGIENESTARDLCS